LSTPLASIGALAMLAAAGVTVADVLLRWLANAGVVALNEVIGLIFAVAIAACIPAGLAKKVNLRLDLLENALPPRFASWSDGFGAATLTAFYGILAWHIAKYAGSLAAQGQTTVILSVPLAPFVYAVACIVGFGAIVQIVVTLSAFAKLRAPVSVRGGSPLAAAAVLAIFALLAAVVVYGIADFDGFAGWIRQNIGLAVALAFLLMWGCLLGLVPLASAVGLIGLVGMATIIGWAPAYSIFATEAVGFLTNSQVSTLPLFLMMGSFAAAAGISDDLYRLAQAVVGGFRGGLALATIAGCGGFGAVTGSSLATAATLGRVALPEMERRGYSVTLATGTIAAGGTLGALVPPSSPLILFALLTESSIGQLFTAAIVPALLAILLYFLVVGIYIRVAPGAAPAAQRTSKQELWEALKGSGAVVLLFGVVIGGLYAGIFTATESAAFGAVGAFLLALVRKRLKRGVFWRITAETTVTTALIYGLIFGALSFSYFMAASGVPETVTGIIKNLDLQPILIIALLLVVFLMLGCVMDSFAVMIITVPIVTPLITGMGYDLIWWGVINLAVIETGMITPPFGLNVFVLKSLLPRTSVATVFKGVLPFVLADLLKLALLVAFPFIVLALPSTMN